MFSLRRSTVWTWTVWILASKKVSMDSPQYICTKYDVFGIEDRNNLSSQDGMLEDLFSDDRTVEKLSNFIWETVDPSRVEEEMDPFLGLMGGKSNKCLLDFSHNLVQV